MNTVADRKNVSSKFASGMASARGMAGLALFAALLTGGAMVSGPMLSPAAAQTPNPAHALANKFAFTGEEGAGNGANKFRPAAAQSSDLDAERAAMEAAQRAAKDARKARDAKAEQDLQAYREDLLRRAKAEAAARRKAEEAERKKAEAEIAAKAKALKDKKKREIAAKRKAEREAAMRRRAAAENAVAAKKAADRKRAAEAQSLADARERERQREMAAQEAAKRRAAAKIEAQARAAEKRHLARQARRRAAEQRRQQAAAAQRAKVEKAQTQSRINSRANARATASRPASGAVAQGQAMARAKREADERRAKMQQQRDRELRELDLKLQQLAEEQQKRQAQKQRGARDAAQEKQRAKAQRRAELERARAEKVRAAKQRELARIEAERKQAAKAAKAARQEARRRELVRIEALRQKEARAAAAAKRRAEADRRLAAAREADKRAASKRAASRTATARAIEPRYRSRIGEAFSDTDGRESDSDLFGRIAKDEARRPPRDGFDQGRESFDDYASRRSDRDSDGASGGWRNDYSVDQPRTNADDDAVYDLDRRADRNAEPAEIGGWRNRPLRPGRNSLRGPRPPRDDPAPLPAATGKSRYATVVLVMRPGNRGIRRYNKTSDPVLCSGGGCYVSGGFEAPARFQRRRRVLGGRNTLGRRAGPCNRRLGCIFRNVDLGGSSAVLQPIDLRMLRHDRRRAQVVKAPANCRVGAGDQALLRCSTIYRARDYVLYVVPEAAARAAGADALQELITAGMSAINPGRRLGGFGRPVSYR